MEVLWSSGQSLGSLVGDNNISKLRLQDEQKNDLKAWINLSDGARICILVGQGTTEN